MKREKFRVTNFYNIEVTILHPRTIVNRMIFPNFWKHMQKLQNGLLVCVRVEHIKL